MVLTRDEGHRHKLFSPLVRQLDALRHPFLARNGVALQVGMLDQVRHVLRTDRVENVEEVGPVGQPTLRQLVREELHKVARLLQLWPDVLHRELVEEGHLDQLDRPNLDEFLMIRKDLLEEILREHRARRHVQLH